MDKYKYGTYHKGYFPVSINDNLKIIMCTDKVLFRQNSKVP